MIYAKTYDNHGELALVIAYEETEGFAPFDVSNGDYLAIVNGKIEIVGAPQETPDKALARLESVLDAYIDAQAKLYRYESIRTMVTYDGDENYKFRAEGKGAKIFRSRCYTLALMVISEIQQGRPIPTESELLAEMPTLESFIVYG